MAIRINNPNTPTDVKDTKKNKFIGIKLPLDKGENEGYFESTFITFKNRLFGWEANFSAKDKGIVYGKRKQQNDMIMWLQMVGFVRNLKFGAKIL